MNPLQTLLNYINGLIPDALDFLIDVVIAFLIFVIGRKLIKVIQVWIRKILNKGKLDEGVKSFLDSLLKLALYFVLIMLVVSRFGVTASSVIAILGSAGLAVGLALQGSLSNFAGGVLILVLRPFEIGDYIKTADGYEGTVNQIQVCYTRLLTVDNQVITIPNGILSNQAITNVTKMDKRRVDVIIRVAYDTDLKKAQSIMRELLSNAEGRILEEDINVFVGSLNESAIEINGRAWVKADSYWPVKWSLNEKLAEAYKEAGIHIPYQQLDVHVKNEN